MTFTKADYLNTAHSVLDGVATYGADGKRVPAQAHAEYAELKREYGLLKIDNEWNERLFKQADQCAHERETALLANDRTIRELERRNAELVAALEHIREYWNRDQNESAMADALWHIIETAEAALAYSAQEKAYGK